MQNAGILRVLKNREMQIREIQGRELQGLPVVSFLASKPYHAYLDAYGGVQAKLIFSFYTPPRIPGSHWLISEIFQQ